jgi:hypothetical protein
VRVSKGWAAMYPFPQSHFRCQPFVVWASQLLCVRGSFLDRFPSLFFTKKIHFFLQRRILFFFGDLYLARGSRGSESALRSCPLCGFRCSVLTGALVLAFLALLLAQLEQRTAQAPWILLHCRRGGYRCRSQQPWYAIFSLAKLGPTLIRMGKKPNTLTSQPVRAHQALVRGIHPNTDARPAVPRGGLGYGPYLPGPQHLMPHTHASAYVLGFPTAAYPPSFYVSALLPQPEPQQAPAGAAQLASDPPGQEEVGSQGCNVFIRGLRPDATDDTLRHLCEP